MPTCSFSLKFPIRHGFRPRLKPRSIVRGQPLYQMASRSVHPFRHNTSALPTNLPTNDISYTARIKISAHVYSNAHTKTQC